MAAYAILWLVTRIPAVNAVFGCTTLSRAYRRYHEPDTGEREGAEAENQVTGSGCFRTMGLNGQMIAICSFLG